MSEESTPGRLNQGSLDNLLDIYVPGAYRCIQCGFQLSRTTIFMQTGELGNTAADVRGETNELCPNDGAPMVRVRWRERATEAVGIYSDLINEFCALAGVESLPEAKEVLRAARTSAQTASDALDEIRRLVEKAQTQQAELDAAWFQIEHGWDIEDRSYFEREAPKNGFEYALAQAVHHMWKRRLREDKPTAKTLHDHLDICDQCRLHPFDLCATGAALLKEAATT